MSWLSHIYPQTILRMSSRYNRDIRINEERGTFKLLVNGSRQSGAYIELLWRRSFEEFGITPNNSVRSILVLGVAGGTVIHLLHHMYPAATITGVDVDDVMLDIGRTYFGLGNVKLLRLIHQDARPYVQEAAVQKKRYDLMIVDLFLGRDIPLFVRSPIFLRQLRRILKKDGTVVINFLRELEYGPKSDKLMIMLKKIFPTVLDFGIYHNRFFAMK